MTHGWKRLPSEALTEGLIADIAEDLDHEAIGPMFAYGAELYFIEDMGIHYKLEASIRDTFKSYVGGEFITEDETPDIMMDYIKTMLLTLSKVNAPAPESLTSFLLTENESALVTTRGNIKALGIDPDSCPTVNPFPVDEKDMASFHRHGSIQPKEEWPDNALDELR